MRERVKKLNILLRLHYNNMQNQFQRWLSLLSRNNIEIYRRSRKKLNEAQQCQVGRRTKERLKDEQLKVRIEQ